ncbi:MAG: PAS domain S-box protein, partial [Reyranella sp.]|nr:PAS domain S-box protein [Reyranella sp.]
MLIYYGGALLLAMLAGVFAFGSAGQHRRVADEFARRTASEGRLAALIENAPVGVIVYDPQLNIRIVNSVAEAVLQRPAGDLIGRHIADIGRHLVAEDGSPVAPGDFTASQVLTSRDAVPARIRGLKLPGAKRTTWLLISAAPIFDARHALSEVAVTFMDVTERRRLERREHNRARLTAAIASDASLSEVLELIAKAIEGDAPQARCSILLVDAGAKCLRLGAAPSLPQRYQQAVDGLAIGPDASACGQAAFSGQRVIAADLEHDPQWLAFRDLARQAELGACWSEPIIGASGVVLGTFAIYYRDACEPDAEDIGLIGMAAELARLAIERKRAEEEILQLNATLERRVAERGLALRQANASLHDSTARIAAILDTVVDGIITIDVRGTVETFNPAAERLFGYASAEVIGNNISMLMPEPYRGEHDG